MRKPWIYTHVMNRPGLAVRSPLDGYPAGRDYGTGSSHSFSTGSYGTTASHPLPLNSQGAPEDDCFDEAHNEENHWDEENRHYCCSPIR